MLKISSGEIECQAKNLDCRYEIAALYKPGAKPIFGIRAIA
jgi:hypothetical protein